MDSEAVQAAVVIMLVGIGIRAGMAIADKKGCNLLA